MMMVSFGAAVRAALCSCRALAGQARTWPSLSQSQSTVGSLIGSKATRAGFRVAMLGREFRDECGVVGKGRIIGEVGLHADAAPAW